MQSVDYISDAETDVEDHAYSDGEIRDHHTSDSSDSVEDSDSESEPEDTRIPAPRPRRRQVAHVAIRRRSNMNRRPRRRPYPRPQRRFETDWLPSRMFRTCSESVSAMRPALVSDLAIMDDRLRNVCDFTSLRSVYGHDMASFAYCFYILSNGTLRARLNQDPRWTGRHNNNTALHRRF